MNKILLKILGPSIGGNENNTPIDGDGDGFVTRKLTGQDNYPASAVRIEKLDQLRKRIPRFVVDDEDRRVRIRKMLRQGFAGGFTKDTTEKDDIETGISVGRNRHGLKLKRNDVFLEDGTPKDEYVYRLMAWIDFHGKEVFDNPLPTAREVGIGGWLEGEDFYLDIVDVYENTPENKKRAPSLGKEQNQISVADLDQIQVALQSGKDKDWETTTIDSGGDGAETLDPEMFKDLGKLYEALYEKRINRDSEGNPEKSLLNLVLSRGTVKIKFSEKSLIVPTNDTRVVK